MIVVVFDGCLFMLMMIVFEVVVLIDWSEVVGSSDLFDMFEMMTLLMGVFLWLVMWY